MSDSFNFTDNFPPAFPLNGPWEGIAGRMWASRESATCQYSSKLDAALDELSVGVLGTVASGAFAALYPAIAATNAQKGKYIEDLKHDEEGVARGAAGSLVVFTHGLYELIGGSDCKKVLSK